MFRPISFSAAARASSFASAPVSSTRLFFLLLSFLALFGAKSARAQSLKWVKTVNVNSIRSVGLDKFGATYASGRFSYTVDFDPGPAVYNLTTTGTVSGSPYNGYIMKLDYDGNFVWALKLCEGNSSELLYTTVDSLGNIFALGTFATPTDLDPGPGVQTVIPATGAMANVFILKLDASGNFVWVKTLSGNLSANSISLDDQGNIYAGGGFGGTVDFDPSASTASLVSSYTYTAQAGNGQGYILKLNASGNYVWAKCFTGDYSAVTQVKPDNLGSVYCAGLFANTVDFDPGPGTENITAPYFWASYFCKLDGSGQLLWAEHVGGYTVGNSSGEDAFTLDKLGNVYNTCYFDGVVDFDPGPGVYNLTASGVSDIYIRKLDPSGNLAWAHRFGGVQDDEGIAVSVSDEFNVYHTGKYRGKVDFDPGPGIEKLKYGAMYVSRFDSGGNYNWAYKQSSSATGRFMRTDRYRNIYVAGQVSNPSVDFDLGPATVPGNGTGWFIQKLHEDSCFAMFVSVDTLKHLSCSNQVGYISVSGQDCAQPCTYAWNAVPAVNTPNLSVTAGGVYSVTVTDNIGCQRTLGVEVKSANAQTGFDLKVNAVTGNFRPGFSSSISLDGFNDGCVPKTGTLALVLDPSLIYQNSYPAPSLINGDTLFWNFSNITLNSPHVMPFIHVATPVGTLIGDTISLVALMTPVVGDWDTTSNLKRYNCIVVGSFDPNDIAVFPQGLCQENYVRANQPLTYTIRFQNTGTYMAEDVLILDTLSAALDLTTIRVVGKSDPVETTVISGNVVSFSFEGINLPDSNANEPGSHGYIIFEIDPLATAPTGSQIINKGSIFFDFNPPVITNDVMNTTSDPAGFPYVAAAALDHYCAISINQGLNASAYTYSYSSPASFGSYATLKGLDPGAYTVTMQDINGCRAVSNSVTVPDTQAISLTSVSILNPACSSSSNGVIKITTAGGAGPFSYMWNNSITTTGDTSTLSALSAGSYIVAVTDGYGCKDKDTLSLTEPAVLAGLVSAVDASCFGVASGSATMTPSGGTPPYTYSWATGFPQTTQTAINLAAGSYGVTVTDSNGCQHTGLATISEPPMLTTTVTGFNVQCFGESNGAASISAAGGVPPYTFTWGTNPVQTGGALTNLAAGTYYVQLLDGAGCELIDSAVVTQPAVLSLGFSLTPDLGNCSGTATVTPQGGTSPFQISWANGGQLATATGLCGGWHEVTVIDDNGCSKTDSVFVQSGPNGVADISSEWFGIYPNPASNFISLTHSEKGMFELRDIAGRMVFSRSVVGNVPRNKSIIDISSLPAGVYVYHFKSEGTERSGKLVVVK